MRQLVAEDIDDDWSRQTEERDQPKHRPEGKKPKFRAGPKLLVNGRAGESGKKCLGENRAPRQQKECDDIFHPASRHRQWHRMVGRASLPRHDIGHDSYACRFSTMTLTG